MAIYKVQGGPGSVESKLRYVLGEFGIDRLTLTGSEVRTISWKQELAPLESLSDAKPKKRNFPDPNSYSIPLSKDDTHLGFIHFSMDNWLSSYVRYLARRTVYPVTKVELPELFISLLSNSEKQKLEELLCAQNHG